MLCENFIALDTKERIEFIGKICHAIMNSDLIFKECKILIDSAEKAGLFENVTILPEPVKNEAHE